MDEQGTAHRAAVKARVWELADQASMHGHQRKGRVKRPFSKEKKTY